MHNFPKVKACLFLKLLYLKLSTQSHLDFLKVLARIYILKNHDNTSFCWPGQQLKYSIWSTTVCPGMNFNQMKRHLTGQTKWLYINQMLTPNLIADIMFQPSNVMLFWVCGRKNWRKLVTADWSHMPEINQSHISTVFKRFSFSWHASFQTSRARK